MIDCTGKDLAVLAKDLDELLALSKPDDMVETPWPTQSPVSGHVPRYCSAHAQHRPCSCFRVEG